MSISLTIPTSAKPYLTDNEFSAAFNVPTLGQYDWGVAANVKQPVLTLTEGSVYIIERVCFSCDIAEEKFLDARNTTPLMQLHKLDNNSQVFPTSQPFILYNKNLEEVFFFQTDLKEEQLAITFTGTLNQTPALVGDATIKANVQLLIYEVQNKDWQARDLLPKTDLGEMIKLRGKSLRRIF